MTKITVECRDQTLYVASRPRIASGGVNEDTIEFSFCEKWTGYVKTAVFYRDTDTVYHKLLDADNTCVIPKEVLTSPGVFLISVFGVKDECVRTSNLISYVVVPGAITDSTEISDPTPSVYTQIMGMMGDLSQLQTEAKSNLVAAINEIFSGAGATVDEEEVIRIVKSTIDIRYYFNSLSLAKAAAATAGEIGSDTDYYYGMKLLVSENQTDIWYVIQRDGSLIAESSGGTSDIIPDGNTLILENGVLKVNTTDVVESGNTRPITSAAVHTTVGNIDVLLGTI